MVDTGLGDAGAGLRLLQPALRCELVAGEGEAEIVADERREAGRRDGVGDAQAPVGGEGASHELPAAHPLETEQRHGGELAGKTDKGTGETGAAAAAGEGGDVQ